MQMHLFKALLLLNRRHVISAFVMCLQTPILMVVQGDPGTPENFTN